MNFSGLVVGVISFLIIGVFHVVVVKSEYYFGKKCWPVFMIMGIICCAVSVFIKIDAVSAVLAVLGFSFFWSIRELFEQEKRVARGWSPANPNKK